MNCIGKVRMVWTSILLLLAMTGCGGGGYGGSSPPPPPPPDTTAPTLSGLQASSAAALNRVTTLTVTATDNVGVAEVRFLVDGTQIGTDTTAPFSFDWDTSAVADGDHVLRADAVDAAGNVGQSAEITVSVQNTVTFTVTLSGVEEVVPVESAGTATADLTINLATGDVTGVLAISGISATAAHIHNGYAGTNGPVLVGFEQDAGDPGLFALPANSTLDAAAIDKLLAGGLYVNAHTAAFPGGEIRGQILPAGFVLRFAGLSGDESVPQLKSFANGRAAVTLDVGSGALVVQANVTGLDDATAAHVHEAYAGANGPVMVPLQQDGTNAGRWFAEGASLDGNGLAAYMAGRLYVNVHSPANPAGEIRGQILPEGTRVLFVELSGMQEVPAVDTPAAGLAALTFDPGALHVTIHVNTTGLDNATGSHLHGAYGGVNGNVLVGLNQDGSNPAHWSVEEHVLDAAQHDALLAGATYINVHTPAHPGGEVRGQVIPDGILFATGKLEGSQEVPAVVSAAGGTFAVTVDTASMMLVAHANTTGADDASAAHLHDAYAGVSGNVAIGLTQDVNVTHWSAVNVALSAAQLAALEAGRYYVNVHTPANPGGEIRGQVVPPPIEVLFTSLSGNQEVPAVASAAAGTAASTVNRETGTVTLHLRATGADDAVASHIHQAFAGLNGGVAVGLTQDASDVAHWSVVEAAFSEAQLAAYLEGGLYVNLHTPANPGGEIRGQIAPRDIRVLFSGMDGDQVVPPVVTAATGLAATTVNLDSRRMMAVVNASGVDDSTSAGIHAGAAGANGDEVLALEQTVGNPGQWSGTTDRLAADSYSAYRAGRLYAQVATPANIGGEIRGQIVPPDAADFDDLPPVVSLSSPGDPVSGTVTLNADASDNQTVSVVRFLANDVVIGTDAVAPYSIEWDTTTMTNGEVTLTAEADDQAGNTGVSADVVVTVQNAVPVTLTQIQTSVLTPSCSGCHNGVGSALPGVMNLSSKEASFAALVNVASIQQPGVDRVEPSNADASYLVRKLEGTAGIDGVRMPLGGPFLSQATIDEIRQWINDGAANN